MNIKNKMIPLMIQKPFYCLKNIKMKSLNNNYSKFMKYCLIRRRTLQNQCYVPGSTDGRYNDNSNNGFQDVTELQSALIYNNQV